jgi:hypothetical protein
MSGGSPRRSVRRASDLVQTPMSSVTFALHYSGVVAKFGGYDRPLAHGEGSAISLNFYAKVSPTISSLFFQRAFAFSGASA